MHDVGHHLQLYAFKTDAENRDAYARSSYNRYYYATFLITREMIQEFNPTLKLNHADYPGFLTGTIAKELVKARKIAQKSGDAALINQLQEARHAAVELANQFEKANAIRILADYYPETPIDFHDSVRFSLNAVSVTEAHLWADRSRNFVRVIQKALRQINV